MKKRATKVLILGPQRFHPNLADAVGSLGITGTIGTVTAGWQERESEDDELSEHLGRRAVNLRLHERGEDVFASDPEFAASYRERQETLRQLQILYRSRLAHALEAARELMERGGNSELLETEIKDAILTVRALDDRHAARLTEVHTAFAARWNGAKRDVLERHCQELASILEQSSALALAGGHVAVLLNRLRLFRVIPMLGARPILAWSAGAMVLPERVVIFHDAPPHGPGNPEILDRGLGICPELVPLPHARKRLNLHDTGRIALLSRRFAPAACIALETGSRVEWSGRKYSAGPGTHCLSLRGTLEEVGTP